MSDSNGTHRATTLISQLLLEDADLRDIVEEFVDGLTVRISELKRAHRDLDFSALTTLAHQLKGAGGSYGYPDISQQAAMMEERFRSQDASQFTNWIGDLEDLAAGARCGLQDT
ncbi:MAG: Hpt domain-containing protein [Phycisphaerae bacterium]|nr:Hpt domain-containing protein [Phycisphaerae bacterium]